jgi:hypothetical protein
MIPNEALSLSKAKLNEILFQNALIKIYKTPPEEAQKQIKLAENAIIDIDLSSKPNKIFLCSSNPETIKASTGELYYKSGISNGRIKMASRLENDSIIEYRDNSERRFCQLRSRVDKYKKSNLISEKEKERSREKAIMKIPDSKIFDTKGIVHMNNEFRKEYERRVKSKELLQFQKSIKKGIIKSKIRKYINNGIVSSEEGIADQYHQALMNSSFYKSNFKLKSSKMQSSEFLSIHNSNDPHTLNTGSSCIATNDEEVRKKQQYLNRSKLVKDKASLDAKKGQKAQKVVSSLQKKNLYVDQSHREQSKSIRIENHQRYDTTIVNESSIEKRSETEAASISNNPVKMEKELNLQFYREYKKLNNRLDGKKESYLLIQCNIRIAF